MEGEKPRTVTKTVTSPSSSPKKLDSGTDFALARGQLFLARYCAHVLGARIGRASPPNANTRQLKHNAVSTLTIMLKRQPDATTSSGTTVRGLARRGAANLRNGDCELTDARKLEDATIDAP